MARMGDRIDAYGVLVGSREGRNLLEDPGVDRITLKWILEKWDGGHELDGSSSGKDRWRAVVNVVMNFRVA